MRKTLTILTAILLACLLPITSFAATWNNVDTSDELVAAFEDTDNTVVINVTGNITLLQGLEADEGKVYTINGENFVIKDVYIYGTGTVNVTADIESDTNSNALVVQDATVSVTGDVTGSYSGVYAEGEATVSVTGDVTGGPGGAGVYAYSESTVTVDGDVIGGTPTEDSFYSSGGCGVVAEEESTVTVTGDVTGGSGNPDLVDYDDATDYSDGNDGIYAKDKATVEVGGNVTGGNAYGTYAYAGNGVNAYNESTVKVGGDVTGGSVTADPDVDAYYGSESYAGYGLEMESTATVEVGGDVTGGSTNGDMGQAGVGAYIQLYPANTSLGETAGELYVAGTISGGKALTDTATAGEGIYYYDYIGISDMLDDAENEFFMSDDEIANIGITDFMRASIGNKIYSVEMVMEYIEGADDAEIEAEYDAIYADLLAILGEAIGKDGPFDENSTEDIEALNAMFSEDVAETVKKLQKSWNDNVQEYFDTYVEFVKSAVFPEVTTWSIESGDDDTAPVGGNDADLAKELNGSHNYIVKVTQPTKGGTVSVDNETANPGETVKITVSTASGYKVAAVKVNGKEISAVSGVYSFEMPEYGGVEVTAVMTSTSSASPNTGDSSMTTLWAVMAAIAIFGMAVIVLQLKKSSAKAK